MDAKAMRKQKAKCNSSEKCRTNLDHVLVGSNTSGFESLGGKLLLLVAQHVHALRESIHTALLLAAIVNTKLWVGDTTAIARLDVRLVLLVAKAPSWTTAHLIRSASNERHVLVSVGPFFECQGILCCNQLSRMQAIDRLVGGYASSSCVYRMTTRRVCHSHARGCGEAAAAAAAVAAA